MLFKEGFCEGKGVGKQGVTSGIETCHLHGGEYVFEYGGDVVHACGGGCGVKRFGDGGDDGGEGVMVVGGDDDGGDGGADGADGGADGGDDKNGADGNCWCLVATRMCLLMLGATCTSSPPPPPTPPYSPQHPPHTPQNTYQHPKTPTHLHSAHP